MRRELEWKRTVLRAWFKAVMNVVSVRYRCRKPFWEWRKHAVKLLQLHRLFAGCFWPIYTWRKVTREAILQRQKAGMLKNIYMTASTLTCFRCWAQWHRERAEVWKKCDAHRAAMLMKKRQRSLLFWRRHCRRSRGIREMWLRKGMRRMDDKNLDRLWRALTVWRYWRLLTRVVQVN